MVAVQTSAARRKKHVPALQNGEHLDQKTFHERYEAMPSSVRAELIGGVVHMSSPMKSRHGIFGASFNHWLVEYEDATPGTQALAGATSILGPKSEAQPDGCLVILPECGGQTWLDEREYLNGAPEWLGEISDSTEALDLGDKKADYEKAGVREYVVAALQQKKVFWFVRRRGKLRETAAGSDGIFRSEVFPGLWFDAASFLRRDRKRLLAVLRLGLAAPEHAAFVARLAAKK